MYAHSVSCQSPGDRLQRLQSLSKLPVFKGADGFNDLSGIYPAMVAKNAVALT